MTRIAVVGSINMDLVVETDIMPQKGETLIGKGFFMCPGGKGANQAVAASRLGVGVSMFGSVGQDENGHSLISNFQRENIDTTYINFAKDAPTGVALIQIADNDNSIVVVPGANTFTDISYLNKVKEKLLDFDTVLLQMEIPIESIEFLVNYLYENQRVVVLNPAPAQRLSKEVIEKVSFITPNEHEYSIVFGGSVGMDSLLRKYPNKLIITQGENGVRYFDGSEFIVVPCIKVDVLDTTGAGDTFSGAFGVSISEGKSIYESISFANAAAGISVTKKGAQAGMPCKNEILKYLKV